MPDYSGPDANGQRKGELVKRANLIVERAVAADSESPTIIDRTTMIRHLAELVRDMADLIANPPCCDGGPQWGHAWTCPTLR